MTHGVEAHAHATGVDGVAHAIEETPSTTQVPVEINFAKAYSDGVHKTKYWSRRTRTCWTSLPNWRRSRRASTATYFNGEQLKGDTPQTTGELL